MKKLLLTILIVFVSSVPLFARLGETREQCEKRYGKHVDSKADTFFNKTMYFYEKGDIDITIIYMPFPVSIEEAKKSNPKTKEVAFYIKYMKWDKIKKSFVNLTKEEIELFIEVNITKKGYKLKKTSKDKVPISIKNTKATYYTSGLFNFCILTKDRVVIYSSLIMDDRSKSKTGF